MVDQATGSASSRSKSPVAWVVGVGASAGLGAALGHRFAQAGLTVALTWTHEVDLRPYKESF
jgi:NADP-dependent 3-hydroxy acid dehydrogenase YdfG